MRVRISTRVLAEDTAAGLIGDFELEALPRADETIRIEDGESAGRYIVATVEHVLGPAGAQIWLVVRGATSMEQTLQP